MDTQAKLGSSVIYLSRSSADSEICIQEALVIGYDPQPEDSKAKFPPAHLMFLHPERLNVLGSADWRTAVDRVSSVPHISEHPARRNCYELRAEFEASYPKPEPAKLPVSVPVPHVADPPHGTELLHGPALVVPAPKPLASAPPVVKVG